MHYSATHTKLLPVTVMWHFALKSAITLHTDWLSTSIHICSTYSANNINLQINTDFKQDFMPEFAQYTFQYVNSNEILCILHAESILSSGK